MRHNEFLKRTGKIRIIYAHHFFIVSRFVVIVLMRDLKIIMMIGVQVYVQILTNEHESLTFIDDY